MGEVAGEGADEEEDGVWASLPAKARTKKKTGCG